MHVQKRMSPFTALFLGVTAIVVAVITSASVIAIYGLHLSDRWATDLIGLTGETLDGLPEMIQALPPAVGDLLHDQRAPEYVDQLGIEVTMANDSRRDGVRPVVTVENRGGEMVTLLGLLGIVTDENGTPVGEWTEYAATPIAIDHDWRGPIMPSATRRFSVSGWPWVKGGAAVEYEITDVRIWSPEAERTPG